MTKIFGSSETSILQQIRSIVLQSSQLSGKSTGTLDKYLYTYIRNSRDLNHFRLASTLLLKFTNMLINVKQCLTRVLRCELYS
jgi:hypothetical protein